MELIVQCACVRHRINTLAHFSETRILDFDNDHSHESLNVSAAITQPVMKVQKPVQTSLGPKPTENEGSVIDVKPILLGMLFEISPSQS